MIQSQPSHRKELGQKRTWPVPFLENNDAESVTFTEQPAVWRQARGGSMRGRAPSEGACKQRGGRRRPHAQGPAWGPAEMPMHLGGGREDKILKCSKMNRSLPRTSPEMGQGFTKDQTEHAQLPEHSATRASYSRKKQGP